MISGDDIKSEGDEKELSCDMKKEEEFKMLCVIGLPMVDQITKPNISWPPTELHAYRLYILIREKKKSAAHELNTINGKQGRHHLSVLFLKLAISYTLYYIYCRNCFWW